MRWLAILFFVSITPSVSAAPRVRFEPTDLELEDTGVFDIDVQLGSFRGRPTRSGVLDADLSRSATSCRS